MSSVFDIVNEPNGKNKKDHDAIFCDGLCKEWIHRQCAGLSRVHYEKLVKSDDPFLRPKCTIHNQPIAIKNLDQSISQLRTDVDRLQHSSNLILFR